LYSSDLESYSEEQPEWISVLRPNELRWDAWQRWR